ncbi:MAG: hypothetical protein ACOY7J_02565, partial [Pseudomonadota bacterium]
MTWPVSFSKATLLAGVFLSLTLVAGCKGGSESSGITAAKVKPETSASEVHTLEDGSRYSGDLVNGKKEGQGLYVWANGDTYEGQWQNDVMSGDGLFKDAQGRIYKGKWASGLFNGK